MLSFQGSGLQDILFSSSLSTREKKRQGHIYELLSTEENYLKDLTLVKEVRAASCARFLQEDLHEGETRGRQVLSADSVCVSCTRIRRGPLNLAGNHSVVTLSRHSVT